MRFKFLLTAFIAGLLFGAGLILSGMTDPANVVAFLDIAGDWNPALAVVMTSAIIVATPAFMLVKRRHQTLLEAQADIANRRQIDSALLTGSAIFGMGWGLSGICPGPGLMLAFALNYSAIVFVAAMSIGMLIAPYLKISGKSLSAGALQRDEPPEYDADQQQPS